MATAASVIHSDDDRVRESSIIARQQRDESNKESGDMPKYSDDPIPQDMTSDQPDSVFGIPVSIVFLTLTLPIIPFIAYLMGLGSVDSLGAWLTGASGWAWVGGYCLLVVFETVNGVRKRVKQATARR